MVKRLKAIIRELASVEKDLDIFNSRLSGKQLLLAPIQVARRRTTTVMHRLETLANAKGNDPKDMAAARLAKLSRLNPKEL